MGIKALIRRRAVKASDTIARLSVLSPEQLSEMQKRRENYLMQVPSMDDGVAEEYTRRLMAAGSVEIYNAYLHQMKDYYVPVRKDVEYDMPFKPAYNIRWFNITKWVTDKQENSLEKLINVYDVLSNEDCNIALVFHRTMEDVKVYLAVTNTQNARDNVDVDNFRKRLAEAIRGNFPGAEWSALNGAGILPCMNNSLPFSVASASNVPGEKSEKFVSQTIEKLLDGIIPDDKSKEYILILLATPVKDVDERKIHLADLYSGLAPYAAWQTDFTYTESDSTNAAATFGLNAGVSAGIQNGRNSSISNTQGVTDSTGATTTDSTGTTQTESTGGSKTETTGTSQSETTGKSTSTGSSVTQSTGTAQTTGKNTSDALSGTVGVSSTQKLGVGGGVIPAEAGTSISESVSAGMTHTAGRSTASTISSGATQGTTTTAGESLSQSIGSTLSQAVTSTTGQAVAQSVGRAVANTLGRAVTNSVTTAAGIYKGVNLGANFGANFARSSNVSATVGKNEGIHQSFTNYTIKHTLQILEEQMKRMDQSTALGMWDFAAYVMSEDQNVANNVAHTYLSLTQGETSYMSQTAVNLWRGDMGEDSENAKAICGYLRELRHPVFGLNPTLTTQFPDFNAYPAIVTAATSLSGKELAYSMNFPQKSLPGFPVIECAEFGRNVVSHDGDTAQDNLLIGNIFHMNHTEATEVCLSSQSLASHTFITGSTGSGKSNTVYRILNEADEKDIHYLVIEPAKGEYKEIFGSRSDVSVYGTNPYLSPMLRVNPFSFPKGIHVFEHLDRLVEIFNVCWPMYAAMPAVLKSAIEKSYSDCGWDLMRSVNVYGENVYPSFSDVARNIRTIIDTSEYDTDNKGAYKGSLLTRLQSLTSGINGTIFVSEEIPSEELFDRNVIIDLSRVGSSETKSLIMGMLILKLQEYRITSVGGINKKLNHITVLEEAHNILRRTSTEQSADSANLMEKSVEMLSNAIAEMRTYGEGFVIVDQAPGLLDMAAIRNTNTKIIMRLPDQGDRELVGRAANLDDDQITELAKLPRGVAAIYQNEWVQPVLCKVERVEMPVMAYHYEPEEDAFLDRRESYLSDSLLNCIMNKELFREGHREDMQKLKGLIIKSRMDSIVKIDFLEYLASEGEDAVKRLRKLLYDFVSAQDAIEASRHCTDITAWATSVVESLRPSIKEYSNRQINLALALLIYEQTMRDASYRDLFCRFTEVYRTEGRVI